MKETINKLTLWAAKNSRDEVPKMVLELIEETEKLKKLKKQIETFEVVAYARTNDRGDLYDLRLQNNPFIDQNYIVPLFSNRRIKNV